MKNRLKLLLFLSIVCLTAQAQKFNGGLIFGFSGSQVAGDTYSGYDKFGLFGGGFVNYQFSDLLTLQMEMEYVQKGSRHNPKDEDISSYKLNLDYVEVPLLLKITLYKGLKIETGLAAAILVRSYEEDTFGKVTSRPFQSSNFSTIIGIAYKVSKKLTASLRFSDSFTPIRKVSNTGDVFRYYTHGQWHDLLTFSLQYQFR